MHNKRSLYYLRARRLIEELLKSYDFHRDALKVHKEEMSFERLVTRYSIIHSAQPVILQYLVDPIENEVDFNLIVPPVTMHKLGSNIVMRLSPDITQPELKDFVLKQFSSEIKPLLLQSSERVSRKVIRRNLTKTNSDIYYLHDMGLKPTEIVEKTGYSLEKVKSTLDRRRIKPEKSFRKYQSEIKTLRSDSLTLKKATRKKPL